MRKRFGLYALFLICFSTIGFLVSGAHVDIACAHDGILPCVNEAELDSAIERAQTDADSDTLITFYEHIEPIFAENCLSCHLEGGIGPVPLDDPSHIDFDPETIAYLVSIGNMPPWMPSADDNPPMLGERTLTEDEVNLILNWYDQGAELGDINARVPVTPAVLPEVRADMTLQMAESYTPDSTLDDDYRCFILDPELEQDRFVTGYNILPGHEPIVHHVLLFQINNVSRTQAERVDARDERPGWQCFGGPGIGGGAQVTGVSNGAGIAGSIGTWAPGGLPRVFPEGTGNLLRADSFIVMQVHYHADNDIAPDQSSVVLQFADEGADIIPLSAMNLIAPVEVPCSADNTSELCNRADALLDGGGSGFSQQLLRGCGASLEDFAEQDASAVTSTCDFPVRSDVWALGAVGHMHELGVAISIVRNPDTPDAQTLLNIPAWDFEWQDSYLYQEPIRLNAGETIRLSCTWDNSEGDRYIVWGEGTEDEMCLGAITIMPVED